MKIYTVVGCIDYEGIACLGPSFTTIQEAFKLQKKCEQYDKTRPIVSEGMKDWLDRHPLGADYDYYDVETHKLVESPTRHSNQ